MAGVTGGRVRARTIESHGFCMLMAEKGAAGPHSNKSILCKQSKVTNDMILNLDTGPMLIQCVQACKYVYGQMRAYVGICLEIERKCVTIVSEEIWVNTCSSY